MLRTSSSVFVWCGVIRSSKRFGQFFPVKNIRSPCRSYAIPLRTPGRFGEESSFSERPDRSIQAFTSPVKGSIRATQSRSKMFAHISPSTVSSSLAKRMGLPPSFIVIDLFNVVSPKDFPTSTK